MIGPGWGRVSHPYNHVGRIETVTNADGNRTATINPDGFLQSGTIQQTANQRTSTRQADGTTWAWHYDPLGQSKRPAGDEIMRAPARPRMGKEAGRRRLNQLQNANLKRTTDSALLPGRQYHYQYGVGPRLLFGLEEGSDVPPFDVRWSLRQAESASLKHITVAVGQRRCSECNGSSAAALTMRTLSYPRTADASGIASFVAISSNKTTPKLLMTKLLLSLAAFAVLVIPVVAKEFKIPKKESIFSVKFPDSWKVTQEDESVEAFSEDEAVALWMQTDDATTIDDSMKANIDYLNEQGVKLDQKTRKDTEGEHNGMPMSTVSWKGTDAESECVVSLVFLHPTKDTAITMLYWATAEEVKKNEKEINGVLDSMKAIGAAGKKKAKADGSEE